MAWNRNKPSNRKWGFRKGKVPVRRLSPRVQTKKYDSVALFNNFGSCRIECHRPPEVNCNQRFVLDIVDELSLATFFNDNVKIVKFTGSIWFRPWYLRPNVCSTEEYASWYGIVRDQMVMLRAGLDKSETSVQAPTGTNPDPSRTFDWVENNWIREWNHVWAPPLEKSGFTTVKPDTILNTEPEWDGYLVPATASGSQDPYSVPAFENCEVNCTAGVCNPYNTIYTEIAVTRPWWRMNFSFRPNGKYGIRLKESDWLSLQIAYSAMGNPLGSGCRPDPPGANPCLVDAGNVEPCAMQFIPNIKMVVELA